jgi:BirA family transcriptional regulator, biotin operon repressor / biotin---[acetyl-CoA-carboxylase] ligase
MGAKLLRAEIEARLMTRFVGRNLEGHETIDSTNTRAVELARQGAPEGTLVLAEAQSAGRGRMGRRWVAPAGSSLLMTLILRPKLAPCQAQRATMVCSLAALEAIHRVTGLVAQVKWPNDIVLNGKKLGGILTELELCGDELVFVVVGHGLNVNLDPAAIPEALVPPTSLMAEAGHPVAREGLLAALLLAIEARLDRMAGGWSPHEEWRGHLATLGQPVRVGTAEEVIEGLAEDVDPDGALLVRTADGALRRVLAGDVTLRGHLIHPPTSATEVKQ